VEHPFENFGKNGWSNIEEGYVCCQMVLGYDVSTNDVGVDCDGTAAVHYMAGYDVCVYYVVVECDGASALQPIDLPLCA
ncbi:hypothetical protein M8C21_027633, partial [Ambrosia artemisiifolia]